MRLKSFIKLSQRGLEKVLLKDERPIVGTVIVTDYCNLECKHCAVNFNKKMYSYEEIVEQLDNLYRMGVRILFLCGGETLLWEDGNKGIRTIIARARSMGFEYINLVTNGTIDLDIPEADLILLSIDGNEKIHNEIRGNVYQKVMRNLDKAKRNNICIYMAINKINYKVIEDVAKLAKQHEKLRGISFNLHTPYKGTEHLKLSQGEKKEVLGKIADLIDESYPVFNVKSSLKDMENNSFQKPCTHCVVSENKRIVTCGRCIEQNLCDECGYLFVAEFTRLFTFDPIFIFQFLKRYLKFI